MDVSQTDDAYGIDSRENHAAATAFCTSQHSQGIRRTDEPSTRVASQQMLYRRIGFGIHVGCNLIVSRRGGKAVGHGRSQRNFRHFMRQQLPASVERNLPTGCIGRSVDQGVEPAAGLLPSGFGFVQWRVVLQADAVQRLSNPSRDVRLLQHIQKFFHCRRRQNFI